MRKQQLRILCPNGHLGFMPTKEKSFWIGAETQPDYYCCDSGSSDIGPVPLGSDTSISFYEWQKHDLELMLLASRKQDVPMIIGSSGDTGTNSRVDRYVEIIKQLAWKHNFTPLKLVYFYSEVEKEYIKEQLEQGISIEGLDGRKHLTMDELNQTDKIIAVAGIHPFIQALKMGADVIIGGRSSDTAVFASAAIYEGFPEHFSYYLGRILECASFCAEPFMTNETVIGTITHEDVKVTAMHPQQRCTVASVTGHAMYERSNPFYEYFAGGMLDMTNCKYEQYDEQTTRITGQVFVPVEGKMKVKLEGSGKVGERFIGIVGIRDPYTIKNIDKIIEWAQSHVEARFLGKNYQLFYKIYGKNGVMRDLEPVKEIQSHELCVIVEGIAETEQLAEELTLMGTRQIFYADLPEIKKSLGTAAFGMNNVLLAPPAYHWTMNHTIPVDDPMKLFEIHELIIE
jgi:hypothetical protein